MALDETQYLNLDAAWSGSQPGAVLTPNRHLAVFRDIFLLSPLGVLLTSSG